MGDNQFIDVLYALEVKFIIDVLYALEVKETFWGTELHFSTSRHPLLLPSILYQCKIPDISLTK